MQNEPGSGAVSSKAIESVTAAASIIPSINKIKEIDSADEKSCIECGQSIKCKYSLMKVDILSSNKDKATAAIATATNILQPEIQYLCDTACVKNFNNRNTQYKVVVKYRATVSIMFRTKNM